MNHYMHIELELAMNWYSPYLQVDNIINGEFELHTLLQE
jgi:hypothetical protein